LEEYTYLQVQSNHVTLSGDIMFVRATHEDFTVLQDLQIFHKILKYTFMTFLM